MKCPADYGIARNPEAGETESAGGDGVINDY